MYGLLCGIHREDEDGGREGRREGGREREVQLLQVLCLVLVLGSCHCAPGRAPLMPPAPADLSSSSSLPPSLLPPCPLTCTLKFPSNSNPINGSCFSLSSPAASASSCSWSECYMFDVSEHPHCHSCLSTAISLASPSPSRSCLSAAADSLSVCLSLRSTILSPAPASAGRRCYVRLCNWLCWYYHVQITVRMATVAEVSISAREREIFERKREKARKRERG